MARERFNNEHVAEAFAEEVDGQVNDCRNIPGAKSDFTVTYRHLDDNDQEEDDWCPEEGRDFGYHNWYWD